MILHNLFSCTETERRVNTNQWRNIVEKLPILLHLRCLLVCYFELCVWLGGESVWIRTFPLNMYFGY